MDWSGAGNFARVAGLHTTKVYRAFVKTATGEEGYIYNLGAYRHRTLVQPTRLLLPLGVLATWASGVGSRVLGSAPEAASARLSEPGTAAILRRCWRFDGAGDNHRSCWDKGYQVVKKHPRPGVTDGRAEKIQAMATAMLEVFGARASAVVQSQLRLVDPGDPVAVTWAAIDALINDPEGRQA